jgi:hypothetical protein
VSAHRCCVRGGLRIAEGGPHPASVTRRALAFSAKIVPVGILAVLPKCPACVAAYVALGTGIGLSLAAAAYIRFALIYLCVSILLYFVMKTGTHLHRGHWFRRKRE